MQGSKQGAAKVISYCRNGEKKHGDIHYTFTRLAEKKRACRTVLSGVTFYFGHEILIRRFHLIFYL